MVKSTKKKTASLANPSARSRRSSAVNKGSRSQKARKSAVKSSKTRNNKKTMDVYEHPLSSAEVFNNREIGWLNFNLRVMAEADDRSNPLFERFKFLTISSTNLDEFFMKRVGGLQRQIAYGLSPKSSDGQTPKRQIVMISQKVTPMLKKQKEIFNRLVDELKKEKVYITHFENLSAQKKLELKDYFMSQIFPILIPLSVDPGHPFPFISNLSTSLAVSLLPEGNSEDDKIFARIKIPKLIDQWIEIGETGSFIHLNEVVNAFVGELFPGMNVAGTMIFKVTRNADSDREDDDDAEDLLSQIEEELRQRRFAEVVRLEFGNCSDPWLKSFLKKELEVKEINTYPLMLDFDISELNTLLQCIAEHVDSKSLTFKTWSPLTPIELQEANSIFEAIDKHDILLHHPYDSFSTSVERFVTEASEDPSVLAIKMTLYRTGDNSPFIKSLINAAENGKQVVCLIELKARFDEERNIYWAQELENAGVHVVYGLVGLKTHAKTTLITRKTSQGQLKTYAHVGTGNYNVVTSRFYTDVGILTCDSRITSEMNAFFNYLTGKSILSDYQHLLVAPINMFQKFKDLILREIKNADAGKPATIFAKFNNMEENDISTALYAASNHGVDVNLIVRGFCCVKPEVKGFSERVRVQFTLGRFLDHSRIFYFRNGKEDPVDGDFYIGSADWMYRNLHARVEAICPVYDRQVKEKLWNILQAYWNDKQQTWTMNTDGSYTKKAKKKNYMEGVQYLFMKSEDQKS